MGGGFGYDPGKDPILTCPSCWARPRARHRSRHAQAVAQRKLLAGIKETPGVEVQLHDQMKAREQLGRILGAFKDGIPVAPAVPDKAAITPAMRDQDAGRAYLRLVGGAG